MTKMRQLVLTLMPRIRGTAQRTPAQPQPEALPARKTVLMTSRTPPAHKPKQPHFGGYASNM